MNAIPRLRRYTGPALLSYGFRPFFLLGAIYAGLAILAWVPMFHGQLELATAFSPRDWHVHEMLFGYVAAIVTGFLLTAVPNWTGRLPIQGKPLAVLVAAWIAGRIAVTGSALWGAWPAAIVDCSFLLLVALATAREIIAGSNWRNLKVLIAVGLLFAGNVVFHVEAALFGIAQYGARMGTAVSIALIMLIGGRIVPSFTRNWLARENPGRLPVAFNRYDVVSMIASVLALALWVAVPEGPVPGTLLVLGGLLQAVRLARWAGERTARDRLVLILHVAYLFVPLGFLLVGIAALTGVPAEAGIHAWTGGAVGAMTLAVMTRASLGHTGRALVASAATQAIYCLVVLATLARIGAAYLPAFYTPLIHTAGLSWALAFLGFGLVYWPVLTRPRLGG
ncbi:NnrS family protein [Chelatococcus daeguensis]|uniref:NnrS family protein n=1 Tax=Chelatococcus TaxID=28209 RepID=UPI0007AC0349|nr:MULTISPECIES: NnrS family protein [Chelatococcus]KZE29259.1 short-chain dehydrogenase [Chelatococcus daeguensis]MBM3083983.1 NnrS family protein [Chelatococcus daeguensis]